MCCDEAFSQSIKQHVSLAGTKHLKRSNMVGMQVGSFSLTPFFLPYGCHLVLITPVVSQNLKPERLRSASPTPTLQRKSRARPSPRDSDVTGLGMPRQGQVFSHGVSPHGQPGGATERVRWEPERYVWNSRGHA